VGALGWLLTMGSTWPCSTAGQLDGATCYPTLVLLHNFAGGLAVVGLAGALALLIGERARR
jgi:hypothetical protein